MTQTQLNNLIIKLKCCSANLADAMATDMSVGRCSNYKELVLLQDYINDLQRYDLDDSTKNCIDSDELDNIVEQSKSICSLCDCGTH